MEFMFLVVGLAFALYGFIALVSPTTLMPKVGKTSGKKIEYYQVQYNPLLVRAFGLLFMIVGLFFAFSDKTPYR